MTACPGTRTGEPRSPCNLVLVVDDEEDIRQTVCDVLADEGYRPVSASNGRDALNRLAENRPCVMLLDLMMPEMNGWQLLEALQHDARLSTVPVVLVTAADHLPNGAAASLRKPFDLEGLLEAVRPYCEPCPSPATSSL